MRNMFVRGTRVTRSERRESLAALMSEAERGAASATKMKAPDAIAVAARNPGEFVGGANLASPIVTILGFSHVSALQAQTARRRIAAAAGVAFAQIVPGFCSNLLALAREKTTLSSPRVSEIIGRSIDAYQRSYGAT